MSSLRIPLPLRQGLALLLLFAVPAHAHAQSSRDQAFYIFDLTTGSGHTLQELNQRAASITSSGAFLAMLREVMSRLDDGFVRYRETTTRGTERRIYWVAANKVTKDDLASMASRGDLLEQVTTLAELDSLFSDTLVVVGDLDLRLAIPYHPVVQGEWQLYWSTPGGDRFEPMDIPVQGDALRISRDLWPAGTPSAVEVVLRNNRASGNLGHCTLYFLSAPQQHELQDRMCTVLREGSGLSRARQLAICADMVRAVYGNAHVSDLAELICP